MTHMKILIIEDEQSIATDVANGLRYKGYSVDCAMDGEQGLLKISDNTYDVIVLDINLPKKTGFEVLQEIQDLNQKVILLSAYNTIESKLKGFGLGANDYLVKPFHFEELEARIRLLLHRKFEQVSPILVDGCLKFDTLKRQVTAGDVLVGFTTKELGILEYFMLNPQRLISQQELIEHSWDEHADVFSNSIRVHMSSLRKKLKNALGYDPIQTKIGEGYLYEFKN